MSEKRKHVDENGNPYPRKEIDYERVERLAQMFCPDYEIAMKIGFSATGFSKRKAWDDELVNALERGRATGAVSVRGKQYELGMSGHWDALKWLGKQYLQQREKHDIVSEGNVNVTIIKPNRKGDDDDDE